MRELNPSAVGTFEGLGGEMDHDLRTRGTHREAQRVEVPDIRAARRAGSQDASTTRTTAAAALTAATVLMPSRSAYRHPR